MKRIRSESPFMYSNSIRQRGLGILYLVRARQDILLFFVILVALPILDFPTNSCYFFQLINVLGTSSFNLSRKNQQINTFFPKTLELSQYGKRTLLVTCLASFLVAIYSRGFDIFATYASLYTPRIL